MSDLEPRVVEALTIEPGKTYVIESEHDLTVEQAQVLQEQWRLMAPTSPLLILTGGLRVSRAEPEDSA